MNLSTAIQSLEKHLKEVPQQYSLFTPDAAVQKHAPGKWSKQEILGHLIDSAINNLKRFTEAQFLPRPYTVMRYQQDEVVMVNHYDQLPASHLLELWVALNRQIAWIMTTIPAEKLSYTIITPSQEEKTLEWLMADYVEHMEHHLRQIFG